MVKIGSDSEYSDDNLVELNQTENHENIESKSKPSSMKNSLSFATTQTVKNYPKKKSIPINPAIIRILCSYRVKYYSFLVQKREPYRYNINTFFHYMV